MFNTIKKIFVRKAMVPQAGSFPRILTIEDDITQRTMIQKTLEKRGYRVLTAENGERGVDMAREEKPDLILLDVMLPGINGQEVCKRLKANTATTGIPIIFLTSMNSPANVVEHFDLGAETHLAKPISARELIRQVEITLEQRPQ